MIEFLRAACIFPSYAFAELQAVAEMLGMPVVTTFKGKGAFPENHPLSMGPIGMHGHRLVKTKLPMWQWWVMYVHHCV